MKAEVVLSPEAREDLLQIYIYVAERAGSVTALRYVERIEAYCMSFDLFPQRGSCRDDLRNGLRTVGFEKRVTIAFHIRASGTVVIDHVLYGGRDLSSIVNDDH